MATPGDDRSKRFPGARFAFLLVFSAFAFTWGSAVLWQGGFTVGKGVGSWLITRASHPILFATAVCTAFVVGAVILVFPARAFMRSRENPVLK